MQEIQEPLAASSMVNMDGSIRLDVCHGQTFSVSCLSPAVLW